MVGNSIGQLFRVTTFGESHGTMIGCVIDGMPPGMKLSENDLQKDLNRRRPGNSSFTSKRKEKDKVKIISGVFNGNTTGTPIGLIIINSDQHPEDYNDIKDIFRPGHADYTYQKKYGIRDYRGGGRSSGRETAMRVAAGSIAKKYLKEKLGITIRAYLSQMGNILCELKNWDLVEQNPFFCPDITKLKELENLIITLKKSGNSIGSKITVIAEHVPIGLGEPVFNKLDADIAHALMSINAVKCVEIGAGHKVVNLTGSQNRDEINKKGFLSNNSGGILGGISNGEPIVAHVTFKPTSSIKIPASTIDNDNNEVKIITTGRHDPCIGIRAVPITEAMIAIIIIDHFLRYKSQCG